MVLGNRQLEETVSVLKEMTAVFASDDDAKIVKNIIKTNNEIVTICNAKQEEMKRIIQGISTSTLFAYLNDY